MTGPEIAARYIEEFERLLVRVACLDDDLRLRLREFERRGWADFSVFPVRIRRLVENLALLVAHITPPPLTAGTVKIVVAAAFFVAGVYEEEHATHEGGEQHGASHGDEPRGPETAGEAEVDRPTVLEDAPESHGGEWDSAQRDEAAREGEEGRARDEGDDAHGLEHDWP